jgi:hypothetical protein
MKDRTAKTSSKTIRPLWADIHKTVENLGKSIGYQKTTLSDSGSLCSEKTWLCFAGLHLLYSEVTHKPHNVKHEHWMNCRTKINKQTMNGGVHPMYEVSRSGIMKPPKYCTILQRCVPHVHNGYQAWRCKQKHEDLKLSWASKQGGLPQTLHPLTFKAVRCLQDITTLSMATSVTLVINDFPFK